MPGLGRQEESDFIMISFTSKRESFIFCPLSQLVTALINYGFDHKQTFKDQKVLQVFLNTSQTNIMQDFDLPSEGMMLMLCGWK